MELFRISKISAAFICFALIAYYRHLYITHIGVNYYQQELMLLFTFGATLQFLQKIEPGTVAELVFFGKATGFFWEDGFCLVPSFPPFLNSFRLSILWSLKKAITILSQQESNTTSIDVYKDQARTNYNMHVNTTQGGMLISRILEGTFYWIIGFEKGNPDLYYQRLGFRIMLLAILLGMIANRQYEYSQRNTSQNYSQSSNSSTSSTPNYKKKNDEKTQALIQLKEGDLPVMPLPEKFVARPDNGKQLVFFVNKDDLRPYYLYHEVEVGKMPITYVTESHCSVIPAGRKKIFVTKYSPRVAVNMLDEVSYKQIVSTKSDLRKFTDSIMGESSYLDIGTWKYISVNWDNVNTDKYGIIVQALPDSELPNSSKGLGGIVCF